MRVVLRVLTTYRALLSGFTFCEMSDIQNLTNDDLDYHGCSGGKHTHVIFAFNIGPAFKLSDVSSGPGWHTI